MEKFIIQGGKTLSGDVEVRGSKNATGPALAATLLTQEECVIENIPLIEDILSTIEVLKSLGAKVEWVGDRKIKIKAENIYPEKINFENVSKTRISVLFFGALLGRTKFPGFPKSFKMSSPGGDKIGVRPISVQLNALEKMGAKIEKNEGIYEIICENLVGREVVLEEFSVTATESSMLAAVLAEGQTVIRGAAAEPHVQDLGKMLLKMGAKIEGLGSHTIKIQGVKKLYGCEHKVIPDPIEAGTFMVMGALTPGKIKVKGVDLSHLDLFLAKLEEIGVKMEKGQDYVTVSYSPEIKACRVQSLPYPGFPTDLLPIIVPLLISAQGKSLVHDPLYENRFSYVQELKKMGANIELVDPHRAFIFGPKNLLGAEIESLDIRAGACLVIAALAAKGETTINNVFQIDRGYEKIEERLQGLGADIRRV